MLNALLARLTKGFSGMNNPLRIAPSKFPDPDTDTALAAGPTQKALLGGGCFWCTEAVFRELDGVAEVISGYAGGDAKTANYQAVCTGRTNHAEVIEIHYDPAKLTYGQILKIFFSVAHDPTQLNRQGNDTGTQYRSTIFTLNDEQKRVAEAYIKQLDTAQVFHDPIVTRLEPFEKFFTAEDYHQDYAKRNPHQPYIMGVSTPKVEKLKAYFGEMRKAG